MSIDTYGDAISSFDRSIILAVNGFAGHARTVDLVIFYVADLNLLKGVAFMAGAWFLWFSDDGPKRNHIVNLIAVALCAVVISRLLQLGLPARVRPLEDPTLPLVFPGHARPGVLHDWSSFPSDHATLFFAMAASLAPVSRLLAGAAAAWVTLVICLPRLYLGYHHASDLIAGAIIGTAIAYIGLKLLPRRFGDCVVHLADRSPAAFYALAFVVTYEISVLMGDVRQLAMQALKILHSILV